MASISSPQTLNRYTYALNNPYKYIDPSGMEPSGDGLSPEDYFAYENDRQDQIDAARQARDDAEREARRKQSWQGATAQGKAQLQQQTGTGNNQQGQAPQQPQTPPTAGLVGPVPAVGTGAATAAEAATTTSAEAATDSLLLPAVSAPLLILALPMTVQAPTLDLAPNPEATKPDRQDTRGAATIHMYNAGRFDPDQPHFSVTVTFNGVSLTTELVLDSQNHRLAFIQRDPLNPAPNRSLTVPLPDARAALSYQGAQLGYHGIYDGRWNNCLTHVTDVLRVGGLNAPEGVGAGGKYLWKLGLRP